MKGYTHTTYGDRLADDYDELWSAGRCLYGSYDLAAETKANVEFLLNYSEPGDRILELGVGTGRIAIPLAQHERRVDGVDSSPKMIAALEAKLQGEQVIPLEQDIRTLETGQTYALAFATFSTFFALTSQEDQLSCMAATSRHLRRGGRFVIDAFLPHRLQDSAVTPFDLSSEALWLDVAQHDPLAQKTRSHHVVLRSDGTFGLYPLVLRYAAPAELDLMARLAGLVLTARYEDWDRGSLRSTSTRHVSVYEKR